jgi:preprotein translocase subunit YajC
VIVSIQPILAQTDGAAGSGWSSLIFLGAMVAVFYFLILRPQRTRMRQQQNLQSELATGDRVQTIGGIQGRVLSIDNDTVVLEVESGRIRVVRRAIAARLTQES